MGRSGTSCTDHVKIVAWARRSRYLNGMTFVASKVLWIVAAPANALLLMLSAGVILCWTRWRRTGFALVSLVTLAFLAIAILPVSSWLYVPLENRFPRLVRLPESVDGIVLLGGATVPGLTAARGQPGVRSG